MTAFGQRFPFGAPVLPCGTELPAMARHTVVVGAYPSALHVRWAPPIPLGLRAVAALPVDNEPTPFWDGIDPSPADLFDQWRTRHFQDGWGHVSVARLNGPSGAELRVRWLEPFGADPDGTFVTDCLPHARASVGVAGRLKDTYNEAAASLDLPACSLRKHPTENDIVAEARAEHDRLRRQLLAAQPTQIITLGNAAARVMAELTDYPNSPTLHRDTYGHPRSVEVAGRSVVWQALIHPAAPRAWQERHSAALHQS